MNILFMILAMYVPVRGMCCGSCSRGVSFNKQNYCNNGKIWTEMAMFLRKYHGYYFSFAITIDWYSHPFESTLGHLTGILNDLLVFWQIICIYTPAHRNKWWCIASEFVIIIHGPLIALGRGVGASMLGFGFTIVFMCTGQWGLPISKPTRSLMLGVFISMIFSNYHFGWSKNLSREKVSWKDLPEIFRIPSIYYLIMLVYFLFYLCVRWIHNVKNRKC